MINKSIHTGSMTNKTYTQEGLLVGDANMLVGDAVGTVGLPYAITNKTLNTASMTNKTLS